jgi:two-component system OmpR family sensor kinase
MVSRVEAVVPLVRQTPALPRRPLPIAARLVVVYSLLVAATLLVVAAVAVVVVRSHLERAIDSQLAADARSFQREPAAHATTRPALLRAARAWLAEQPLEEGEMAAVSVGNRVLTSAGDLDLYEVPHPRQLLTARASRWWNLSGREGGVRGLSIPIRVHDRQLGTLVLLAYKEKVQGALGAVLSAIGWASTLGVAFAGLLGFAVVRRGLRPLTRITREIEAIEAAGDLAHRVAGAETGDEIGRLAAAFDRMLARLEQSFRTQQRFLADASHELRTPLTVARGQLELLAGELDCVEQSHSVAVTTGELDRMARIVDDLLLLARLDEGMQLERDAVEVELLLREALLRALLFSKRRVDVDAEPGVYALADPERLQQALMNLISNAVEHTDDDGNVTISSSLEQNRAVVRVQDTGPGIAADELPHVFERLYRGRAARGRRRDGAGLGLAIAASVVQAMDGEIAVMSTPGSGTTFTITLPAARPA